MNRARCRKIRAPQKRPARRSSDASYSVGYGKPPIKHQFKPGQSGNRNGRPKGAKNTPTLMHEMLDRKIEIRIKGINRKVSIREAILTRFTEAALKGDIKAAAFLLRLYEMSDTGSEHATDTAIWDDVEIINAFLEDLKSKGEN